MNESHIEELKLKHVKLDNLIREEMASPDPDNLKLQEWKKLKLRLKEEIAGMSSCPET